VTQGAGVSAVSLVQVTPISHHLQLAADDIDKLMIGTKAELLRCGSL
jgi:hypothetical protein